MRQGLKQITRAGLLWLVGMTAASAQDAALSLLPQDQPARTPWSLFQTRIAPEPAPSSPAASQDEPASSIQTDPRSGAPAAAPPSDRKGWKLVTMPLPPIPDRPRRVAQPAKTGLGQAARPQGSAETIEQARAEIDAAAAPPPQPKATGLFALLFTDQTPAESPPGMNPAPESAAEPQAPAPQAVPAHGDKARRADLTDPLRPRNLPGPADAEDDLDLEETQAGVIKQVSHVAIACLKPQLLEMIRKAGEHFGAMPVITSGQRGSGRRGSLHRSCEAADFVIPGVETHILAAYLRKMPGAGGVGTYCHTKSVHLDTGEPRDWRYCGFSRRFALRTPVATEIGSR